MPQPGPVSPAASTPHDSSTWASAAIRAARRSFAQGAGRADVGGLWLVLIGMFVMSAAVAETAAAALAGIRVGDVMTSDPDIGGTWLSVSDFIDRIALNSVPIAVFQRGMAQGWTRPAGRDGAPYG